MNFRSIFLTLCLAAQAAIAQTKFYAGYNWEKKPVLTLADTAYNDMDFYSVYQNHIMEYAYDSNGELSLYETWHEIIHINTDKGVEIKNKMYIPSGKIIEMIDLKARCINASGKVINLDQSGIKHVDNLEDMGPHTIFAYEGVEPNSDIEYIYTAKKSAKNYGAFNTQFSHPIKRTEVHFISPKNLVYDVRSYNGFPAFVKDTSDANVAHLLVKAENTSAFEEEPYSVGDANRYYFYFQLRYNTNKSNAKFSTWNLLANDLIKVYYNPEKEDSKAVAKLISKSGAGKKSTDIEKIRALEHYVKQNIVFSTDVPDMSVEKSLSQKLTNAFNLNRIFVEASRQMGLSFELVFSNNRFESTFDPAFESYLQLKELLIYYPSMDKYLDPANYYSRIGFAAEQYILTPALFAKATEVAGVTAGVAKIKTIGTPDYLQSQNIINVKTEFIDDDFTPKSQIEHQYTGYAAYNMQPVYYVMNEEQKKKTTESILKQSAENTIIKSSSVRNGEADAILEKPFIISGTIETPSLVENAGNKHLYKLGMLIGRQAELYQEKPRKYDIVLGYPHGFQRNLEVSIPDGYRLTNPESLVFNVVLMDNGKESSYFKSSYKLEGNKLLVTVSEQYTAPFYSKDKYKEFKDVINAAADFNKVTLIFEKK